MKNQEEIKFRRNNYTKYKHKFIYGFRLALKLTT